MSNFPQYFVSFFFFFLRAAFVLSQSSCPESRCGNLTIKFPLWLKSSSSSNSTGNFCGFPDLGVDCENGTAILHAGNDTYLVDSSGESGNGYTFKDRDLLGSPCPRARHNLTLVKDQGFPLLLGGSFSIFFYFNCTVKDYLPLDYVPLPSCIANKDGKKSFAVSRDRTWNFGKHEDLECEDIVESPVKKLLEGWTLNITYAEALQGGFEMVVSPVVTGQCADCERRNGTCTFVKKEKGENLYEFSCTIREQLGTLRREGNDEDCLVERGKCSQGRSKNAVK